MSEAAVKKIGRPSDYRPEFAVQTEKLCTMGATDFELARYFEVSTVTLNAWKHKHPAFLNALKLGKEALDANPDLLMPPASVAGAYWQLYQQPKSAWTFEMEIRPFGEKW